MPRGCIVDLQKWMKYWEENIRGTEYANISHYVRTRILKENGYDEISEYPERDELHKLLQQYLDLSWYQRFSFWLGSMTPEQQAYEIKEFFMMIFTMASLSIMIFGLYLAITGVFGWRECVENKVVRTVGGCNFLGKCDVKYADGTFGKTYDAIAGKEICYKKSWYKLKNDSLPMTILSLFGRK